MELKTKELLDSMGIPFEDEKTFDDCRHVNVLKFDFYIPTLQLLVELDGIQHFKSVGHWGGQEKFQETEIKDQVKNKYVIHKKLSLLRISFEEAASIETHLKSMFNDLKSNAPLVRFVGASYTKA